MNVVHLYDGHERIYEGQGSLPRIIWNIAHRTAARGHDVTILERQWKGLNRVSEHDGVTFRRLQLRTGSDEPWEQVPYDMADDVGELVTLVADRINFGLAALGALREIDYDVIHVYLPFSANVLVTIAPWLRKRMVYTAQLGELRLNSLTDPDEDDDLDVPGILRRFSPDVYLAKRVAHTTVLNQNVKRIFERNGVSEERVVHIPNGVNIDKFTDIDADACEAVREKFDLDDRPIVLFVGTVMPRKGVVQLVEAVGKTVEAGQNDLQLVIAGETGLDDDYMDRVRSIMADFEITEHVTFTGYLDDPTLVPLYEVSDVFVLPSFEEGFGMVVSEAMATGTPAIGSAISGIKQQIQDGHTGLLVDAGDADELTDALCELLADPEKRRTIGHRSRRHARQFSWETITDQYVDVYSRTNSST